MIECPNCRFLVDAGSQTCRFCGGAVAAAVFATASAGVGASSSPFRAPPPPPGFAPPAPGYPAGAGYPPHGYVPPPAYGIPGGRPRSRAKSIVPIAIGVIVVLVGASLGVLALAGKDDSYPAAWDPQVQPLVDFVESERGLAFKHPVYVDFKPDQAFREAAAPEPLTAEEKLINEQYSAFYRALGLVSGEFDLAATDSSMTGDAALAFYDFETKRITVRGEGLDDDTKPTLVHELTHAMQDQHFDLKRLHAELDEDQMEGLDAVVEGDAERIEARYVETLDGADAAAADEGAEAAAAAEAEGSVYDSYPPTLVALFTAPYALGHPLVELLDSFGSLHAIDDAIMDPPHSSEYMMNPFEYIKGNNPAIVPTPALADGEVRIDEGSFGPVGLFLVLQERLGGKAALHATDGWGGDRYVVFERDKRVCTRVDFHGDTPDAQTGIAAALGAWRDAMPAGSVSVTAGEYARFEACDPGPTATFSPPPDGDIDRLFLPAVRSGIAAGADPDKDAAYVECVASTFVDVIPVSVFLADDPDAVEVEAARAAVTAKCG